MMRAWAYLLEAPCFFHALGLEHACFVWKQPFADACGPLLGLSEEPGST